MSVFRVADAGRSRYDSVFSGLMVVHRKEEDGKARTRTQTAKGGAFFGEFSSPPVDRDDLPPCPSPPPVEKEDGGSVYVTEVHAPSPSPSPPPMPRVQRQAEGGGFRLLLAAVADQTNQAG